MNFKLKSPFSPTGDQPQAIEKLVEGLKKGEKHQTLLGVTGSGMTFTVEPGIYVQGLGGVRIEDDVWVTDTGADTLTSFPRALRSL